MQIKDSTHIGIKNSCRLDEQFDFSASGNRCALVQRGGLRGSRAGDRRARHRRQHLRDPSDAAQLGPYLAASEATLSHPRRLRPGRSLRTLRALIFAARHSLFLLKRPFLFLH